MHKMSRSHGPVGPLATLMPQGGQFRLVEGDFVTHEIFGVISAG